MNLVTVASNEFITKAVNLMCSYRRHVKFNKIIFCHFNADASKIAKIASYFAGNIIIKGIEKVCPHAHDPHMFFFKTFAIHEARRIDEPFLYLDAASLIINPIPDLENKLNLNSRVFVQYPPNPFFYNEKWTTNKCFDILNCNAERFRKSFQYVGGIQAYYPTKDNWAFIDEMFELMKDQNVAGPSCKHDHPDGPNTTCFEHRNEQSLLSILIERNGWHQPYDEHFFSRYGDVQTVIGWALEPYRTSLESIKQNPAVVHRQSRRDFIPPELIGV